MQYLLEDAETYHELATGEIVVVAYNYRQHISIPIPNVWRKTILEFEQL
jgi:acyl-CoA thioesterase FadM